MGKKTLIVGAALGVSTLTAACLVAPEDAINERAEESTKPSLSLTASTARRPLEQAFADPTPGGGACVVADLVGGAPLTKASPDAGDFYRKRNVAGTDFLAVQRNCTAGILASLEASYCQANVGERYQPVVVTFDSSGDQNTSGCPLTGCEFKQCGPSITSWTSDNSDSRNSRSGTWTAATSLPRYFGSNYERSAAGATGTLGLFRFRFPDAVDFEIADIAIRVPNAAGQTGIATNMIVDIVKEDVTVNSRVSTEQWVTLGTYQFEANPSVHLLAGGLDGRLVVDAISFSSPEGGGPVITIDDADAVNIKFGAWESVASSAAVGGSYQRVAGNSQSRFRFEGKAVPAGDYTVSLHLVPASDGATNVTANVVAKAFRLDATRDGGKWKALARVKFFWSGSSILLSGVDANGALLSDAVRAVKVAD